MPINKAVLAAFKAATRLRPDIREFYKAQRFAEDVSAKLMLPNPRCRIDEATAVMPDGFEVPLRVFTPLDFDFSLAEGLKVCEDSRGTVLFFHGGGWVNGTVDFYIDASRPWPSTSRRVSCRWTTGARPSTASRRHPKIATRWRASCTRARCCPTSTPITSCCSATAPAATWPPHCPSWPATAATSRRAPRCCSTPSPTTTTTRSRRGSTRCARTAKTTCSPGATSKATWSCTQSSPLDRANPYFAPLLEPDLSHQPRTLVISAEYCPLRDEGKAFAARLELEGSDVQCYRMLDAVHGYLLYPSILSLVRDAYRIIKHFLDDEELTQEGEPAWLGILGTD